MILMSDGLGIGEFLGFRLSRRMDDLPTIPDRRVCEVSLTRQANISCSIDCLVSLVQAYLGRPADPKCGKMVIA